MAQGCQTVSHICPIRQFTIHTWRRVCKAGRIPVTNPGRIRNSFSIRNNRLSITSYNKPTYTTRGDSLCHQHSPPMNDLNSSNNNRNLSSDTLHHLHSPNRSNILRTWSLISRNQCSQQSHEAYLHRSMIVAPC